jgi:hypothetical protein
MEAIPQEVQLQVGDLTAGLYLISILSEKQHQIRKISIVH